MRISLLFIMILLAPHLSSLAQLREPDGTTGKITLSGRGSGLLSGREFQFVESSSGLNNPAWEGGMSEVEMADVNRDGFIDILSIGDHGCPYVNTQEHGIMVWFGNGQGQWAVQMTGDFGYGGIAVGDVNNDGHGDRFYKPEQTSVLQGGHPFPGIFHRGCLSARARAVPARERSVHRLDQCSISFFNGPGKT